MDQLNSLRVSWFCFKSYNPLAVLGLLLACFPPGRVEAELMIYRNAALFSAATTGRSTNVVNFDSTDISNGVFVLTNKTYQGIVFGQNASIGGNLVVTDGSTAFTGGLKAFSGKNFLGSDAGELISFGTLQSSFSFSFQSPVSAVGFYIISNMSNQLLSNQIKPMMYYPTASLITGIIFWGSEILRPNIKSLYWHLKCKRFDWNSPFNVHNWKSTNVSAIAWFTMV